MTDLPMMTADEVAFLGSKLRPSDRVFEWGSGASTRWFAGRVARVTTVEHQLEWARALLADIPPNVSLLYVPPSGPWVDTGDDGNGITFRDYVQVTAGRQDVFLIDGRARVECAAFLAKIVSYLVNPPRCIFLHDCHRPEYAPIWETHFREVDRVGNLMLLTGRNTP
jgi:hypothetical protein